MREVFKARTLASSALLLCLGFATPGLAQTASPTADDLDTAFEAVLADPTNLDAAFEYARIAAALGDYEAAVSSLERMLIYNPNLPRVHVELGVLYYRLGSFDAARGYFEQALAFPDVPPVVQARVNRFLSEIDSATSKHRFTGVVSGGLRYQTNANSGPGANVLAGGVPVRLDPAFRANDDVNVFASGQLAYSYDFGGQAGDTFDANASLYLSQQAEVDDLDVRFLEVDFGPTLHFSSLGDLAFRPYLVTNVLGLTHDLYQTSVGGGAEAILPLQSNIALTSSVSLTYTDFHNSEERPNADDLDGREARFSLGARFVPMPILRLGVNANFRNVQADADFQSYLEVGVQLTTSFDFPAPVNITDGSSNWTWSLDLRGMTRNYDDANPLVSTTVRKEMEVRADSQVYIPISATVGAFSGIGWRDVRANISNFSFDNLTVMGGVSARF